MGKLEGKVAVITAATSTIDTPALDPLGRDAKEYFKTLVPRGEIGRPEELSRRAMIIGGAASVAYGLSTRGFSAQIKTHEHFELAHKCSRRREDGHDHNERWDTDLLQRLG